MKQIKSLILISLILFTVFVQGQYKKAEINYNIAKEKKIDRTPIKSEVQTIKLFGEAIVNSENKNWNTKLKYFGKSHKLSQRNEQIKKEKTRLKISEKNTHYSDNEVLAKTALSANVGMNFEGNKFTGGFPPDNALAISNNGIIVSAMNSNLEYYNTSGTLLYSSSFDSFFNNSTLTSSLYDPVILYDSGSDRFFMVILHGTSSSTSKVMLCFSKSNNPLDGWWIYSLTGNPLNDNSWFDYPKIGVSNSEVFVTGNLFSNSGSFNKSIIYQIPKSNGYSGGSISGTSYWTNLSQSPFSLVPVSYGHQGNYGPGLFFISTDENGSWTDKLRIYNLTDNLNGSPSINIYSIDTSFELAGNALQQGTSVTLDTGDNRGLNAFYLNGYIHFVFHSELDTNYNGIDYNRIKVSNLSNTRRRLGLEGYDYSYPAVVSYATSTSDKSVVIAFLRSGSNIYPQTRAVYCDNNMDWSSSFLVKAGESYSNSGSASNTRWGDYTGISRKHNASTPEVWIGAQYGNSRYISGYGTVHCLDTWITQIKNGGTNSINDNTFDNSVKVFPNPVYDIFNLEFNLSDNANIEIKLFDINGRLVKLLYQDLGRVGKNVFSFNKNSLVKGVYYIRIKTSKNIIKNEKIIIK